MIIGQCSWRIFLDQRNTGVVEIGIPTATEGVVVTESQKKNIEDQKLKDLKANNNLFQALDCTVLETILNKETSKSTWDSMRKENLSTSFFARTLTIVNKMKANDESKGDGDMVAKILRSMTQNFNYVAEVTAGEALEEEEWEEANKPSTNPL
ncbi:UNVERIFIED_CONTAM: hypothetical protein Sangu_2716000 [Sesamum angustifolium]|uniref:Retrovirus-related Pol polyprotein from transposon TNT 1-94 n=1 Tax=Sesamum angustifolium TaxID=2727405 RepID=A0AAW2IXN3_9LAMI